MAEKDRHSCDLAWKIDISLCDGLESSLHSFS